LKACFGACYRLWYEGEVQAMERMRQRGMAWGGRVGKEVRGRDVEREKVDFMSGVKKSTIINRDRKQLFGGRN